MSELASIRALIEADIPVMLWGAPGTGKTSAIEALARESGAHLVTLIASTVDPVDVGSYLIPSGGTVVSMPPPWARDIRAKLDAREPVWLFLDEFSCAPGSVQAAFLRVIQSRAVGELSVRGCRVVAASNPADYAADGGELRAATANRFAHIDWKLSVGAWISGTLAGWGAQMSKAEAQLASSVTEYVRRNPASLLRVPENADAGRAWPSPRSWSAFIRAAAPLAFADQPAVGAACIGATAFEWAEYARLRDLPDPEEVLAGRANVPERGDAAYATLGSVVAAVLSEHRSRTERIAQAWNVLARVRPDVAITSAQTLLEYGDGEIPDVARDLARRIRGASSC